MDPNMQIELVTRFEVTLLSELNELLPQLSSSALPLGEAELRAIIDSDATHILTAREDGRLLGALTLVAFRIPTGVRSWIEDVIVNEADRGRGVAQALLETAVELARTLQAKTLDLTSRPEREAANRLYRRVGFEQRATNVYRLKP
jgi:ribosomal protein S18 acetylase RimI-like enzyme